AGVNELLTSAAKWVRDECGAEDEESDSFMDLVICGVGSTETRLEYDDEPDGKLVVERIDPLEIYVDGASRRGNFADARHVFRVRQVDRKVAEEMFPDIPTFDLDAAWARDENAAANEPHDQDEARLYRIDQSPEINKETDQVTLV